MCQSARPPRMFQIWKKGPWNLRELLSKGSHPLMADTRTVSCHLPPLSRQWQTSLVRPGALLTPNAT